MKGGELECLPIRLEHARTGRQVVRAGPDGAWLANVAYPFGVGALANDHHGRVEMLRGRIHPTVLAENRPRRHRTDPLPDRCPALDRVVARHALPLDGEAPALPAAVVRVPAGHQDAGTVVQREDPAPVLQQNQRLPHRLTGDFPVLRRSKLRIVGTPPSPRAGPVKEAARRLDAQDPSDGVVDSLDRHRAALHLRLQPGDEGFPRLGHHEHVDSGVYRHRGSLGIVVGQRIDPVPVGDHEPAEPHLPFEHVPDQVAVCVALRAVPAAQRHHYG